jgi:hypothetical protein
MLGRLASLSDKENARWLAVVRLIKELFQAHNRVSLDKNKTYFGQAKWNRNFGGKLSNLAMSLGDARKPPSCATVSAIFLCSPFIDGSQIEKQTLAAPAWNRSSLMAALCRSLESAWATFSAVMPLWNVERQKVKQAWAQMLHSCHLVGVFQVHIKWGEKLPHNLNVTLLGCHLQGCLSVLMDFKQITDERQKRCW